MIAKRGAFSLSEKSPRGTFWLSATLTAPFSVLAVAPPFRTIIAKWHQLGAQQDAGEFLGFLLEGAHEEGQWPKVSALSETPIHEVENRLKVECEAEY